MLETGIYHRLRILRKSAHGVYLNKEDGSPVDDVLLPIRQVPAGAAIVMKLMFLYTWIPRTG